MLVPKTNTADILKYKDVIYLLVNTVLWVPHVYVIGSSANV